MPINNSETTIVDSQPVGIKMDSEGSPISGVRMDPSKAYSQIPELLEKYIDNNDDGAWTDIVEKIDYIYSNLDYALVGLERETNFVSKIKFQLKSGKKLLFKPNLVNPAVIDPATHGEGAGAAICTEWPIIAAIMRWFHDKLHVNYFQMALGEASTTTFFLSYSYSKTAGKNITTEAVYEGRSGDFYGGWGFYFVRKYLTVHHPATHTDDPMNGYEESISGEYITPGKTGNQLMVYDLNKLEEDKTRGRNVVVPDGKNYKEITLHKVIVGGNPKDSDDMRDYPGCVLINVPKPKMHDQDMLTNSIKNLGIGLYPTQCPMVKKPDGTCMKYAYTSDSIPIWKGKLPHSPWVLMLDPDTAEPVKDKEGKNVVIKTDGFSGTQTDVIRAVQSQNVFMLHVADAINIINVSHNADGFDKRIPEGYIWSSLDCVALDLFIARYCFTTVPMQKAFRLMEKYHWNTEFVHYVPEAEVEGCNIKTTTGIDSPLFHYNLYRYAEDRGVGRQKYYVVGWDSMTETTLVSVKGHLGQMENDRFHELMTKTMYYNRTNMLHSLEKTILSYAKACDELTGSSVYEEIMGIFDENHDGVIDYDEMGRGFETAIYCMLAHSVDLMLTEICGMLRYNFYQPAYKLKNSDKRWNPEENDYVKERLIMEKVVLAYELSQSEHVMPDRFIRGMSYGRGMWPSWQTVDYICVTNTIYGSQTFESISLASLYGSAFQYADKVLNAGAYTGSINEAVSDPDSIKIYFKALSEGAYPLHFTFYVPKGYGSFENVSIPNVRETDDPERVFTVYYREVW